MIVTSAPGGASLIVIVNATYDVDAWTQSRWPRALSAAPAGADSYCSVKPVAYADRLISVDPPGRKDGACLAPRVDRRNSATQGPRERTFQSIALHQLNHLRTAREFFNRSPKVIVGFFLTGDD